MPVFFIKEGRAYCFEYAIWSFCRYPTTCATNKWRMLNSIEFKLVTMIHMYKQMIPFALQVSGPRSRPLWTLLLLEALELRCPSGSKAPGFRSKGSWVQIPVSPLEFQRLDISCFQVAI